MSLRQRRYLSGLVMGAGFLLALLCWFAAATVAAQPASQPAGMPVVNIDDPMSLLSAFLWAVTNKVWWLLLFLLCPVYLFVERHTPGIVGIFNARAGARVSAWMSSRNGIILAGLLSAAWTAGAVVISGGWKKVGLAVISAVIMGGLQAALQYGKTTPAQTPPA